MDSIPADTLKAILALRKENGLEPTEAALTKDLLKSKAKWTLVETPRYRRAGRSPLFISGRFLSSTGKDPATGERDQKEGQKLGVKSRSNVATGKPAASGKIDETAFYKVLHGKGFAVKISQDLLTGEVDTQIPSAISKLGLDFSSIPQNAEAVHVTQTSPQIQVSMSLEKFLELTGIKP